MKWDGLKKGHPDNDKVFVIGILINVLIISLFAFSILNDSFKKTKGQLKLMFYVFKEVDKNRFRKKN